LNFELKVQIEIASLGSFLLNAENGGGVVSFGKGIEIA
jgi:hypothetical protein